MLQPAPSSQPGAAALDTAALEAAQAKDSYARALLTARLADVVTWPGTRISNQERQLAGDVLLELLRTASSDLRQRLAERLALVEHPPKSLLRYLAQDEIAVARPLLAEAASFDDSDLVAAIRGGAAPHWRAIAGRRQVSEIVAEELVRAGDLQAIAVLLANPRARLSQPAIEACVRMSRESEDMFAALLRRPELQPTQALLMFWWAGFDDRVSILRRFAAERRTIMAELSDVFAAAAREGWADPASRKALQVVERRQRNRAALARSPFESLEAAVEAAAVAGMDRETASEIAFLSGLKPATMAHILSDPGGEGVGVYAKAVGLRRDRLRTLWRALRRPCSEDADTGQAWGRALYVFEIMAAAKAQTALRYWNWSFSADAAGVTEADAGGFDDDVLTLTPARRNAALLKVGFGRRGA